MSNRSIWITAILAASVVVFSVFSFARADGSLHRWGGGSPAIMGGYGMGPGMMGGYGMGPGMMGGHGMGPGMTGWHAGSLNREQQGKVEAIMQDVRRRDAEIAEKSLALMNRMHELGFAAKRDSKAIAEAHRNLLDLRQQSFELMLDAQDRLQPIFDDAQRSDGRR